MKNFPNVNEAVIQQKQPSDEPPKKAVHFADSKGHPLTLTHVFATETNSSLTSQDVVITDNITENDQANNEGITQLLNFKPYFPRRVLKDRVTKQNVCLERLLFTDAGVRGRVQVRNLAYEKKVFIRYTFDSWMSSADKEASYVPNSCTQLTDSFEFVIECSQDSGKMEFAICYTIPSGEFWDNNCGENYRLVYAPEK